MSSLLPPFLKREIFEAVVEIINKNADGITAQVARMGDGINICVEGVERCLVLKEYDPK